MPPELCHAGFELFDLSTDVFAHRLAPYRGVTPPGATFYLCGSARVNVRVVLAVFRRPTSA